MDSSDCQSLKGSKPSDFSINPFNFLGDKNPLFVVGGADSTCPGCCDSEIILRDLLEYTKDKARLSYPEKHKK